MGRTIPPELRAEFEAVAEGAGCDLLEIEFSGNTLRVILDHPEGVQLSHCEKVSRQLSPLLDVADLSSKRYVLEVSSPGLDRKLYGPQDYARFAGNLVRVTHFAGPERRKQTIVGRLEDFDAENGGSITVHETATGTRHSIALGDVKIARLEIDL